MRPQNLLIIVCFSFLYLSCHKDDPVIIDDGNDVQWDTVYPGDYFPAYPASWWSYSKLGGGTFLLEMEDKYQQFTKDTLHLYLPKIKGIDWYVRGNTISYYSMNGGPGVSYDWHSCVVYLDGSGATFSASGLAFSIIHRVFTSISHPYFARTLVSTLPTITTGNGATYNDVLLLEELELYDSTHHYLDYFALDVGLVRRDSISILPPYDTLEILTLEDYFIGE